MSDLFPEPNKFGAPSNLPPPAYEQTAAPPAGYRLAMSTETLNASHTSKEGLERYGPSPAFDLGQKPTFVCSIILSDSVHPGKFAPHLGDAPARYSFGGREVSHRGRFDILPITHDMEWVATSKGVIPQGRRPVEAGFEKDGRHLFHALGTVPGGTQVLGKTGRHLGQANVAFGGKEVRVEQYSILCWKG